MTDSPSPAAQRALTLCLDITGLLMALPVLLFFTGFFPIPVHLLMLALTALLLAMQLPTIEAEWRVLPRFTPKVYAMGVFILALAVFSSLLAGYGGVFTPTRDMPRFIFIFQELLHNPWPVHHNRCEVPSLGCDIFLRYYLGYFLLPALIGKFLVLENLNLTILIVSTMYFSLLYTTATLLLLRTKQPLLFAVAALTAFFLFGDFDTLLAVRQQGIAALSSHNEFNFGSRFEYFSTTSMLRWMPHCEIPALYAALFFVTALQTRRYSLAECVLPFLAVCVWSVLVGAGFAFLLGVYALFARPALLPPAHRACWVGIALISIVLGGILYLYYRAELGRIPADFSWPEGLEKAMLFDIGPLAALCLLLLRGREAWVASSILAMLFVLPVYHLGMYNDLGRYGGAPMLAALKLLVLRRLFESKQPFRQVIVLLLIELCVLDGISAVRYGGAAWVAKASLAFDSNNYLGFINLNTVFASQYFAPCQEGFLSVLCR